MSDGGKGSARRPGQMPDDAWERTFSKPEIEDDLEDEICSWCSGSGEGMYDGSTCYKCKGCGHELGEKKDDGECYDIED